MNTPKVGLPVAPRRFVGTGVVTRQQIWIPFPYGNFDYSEARLKRVYYQNLMDFNEFARTIDPNTGLVKQHIDTNDKVTTLTYDKANRLNTLAVPGGYDPTNWDYSTFAADRRVKTVSGSTNTVTEADPIGRTASAKTLLDSSMSTIPDDWRWSWTKSAYDSLGRVTKAFEPAFSEQGAELPHTAFTYDALGRLTANEGVGTDDGETLYVYNGNKVTITPPKGAARTEVYSAFGWLQSVTLALATGAETTTYTHDALGRLTKVDAPGIVRDRTYTYNELGLLVAEDIPEAGLTQYRYDEYRNLLERRDADGKTSRWQYDFKNRQTEANHTAAGGVLKTYTYDRPPAPLESSGNGLDRLWRVEVPAWGSVITYDDYDDEGRLLEKTETIDGVAVTTDYDYNAQGLVERIDYPHTASDAGRTLVTYDYNAANLATHVSRNGPGVLYPDIISNISYDPTFRPTLIEFMPAQFSAGVDVRRVTSAAHRFRPERIYSTGSDRNLDLRYHYDIDGTIDQITTNGRVDTYTYEPDLRRLKSVKYGPLAMNIVAYAYDSNGNLLNRATPNPGWAALPGFVFNYSATDRNRLTGTGITYTDAGRMQTDGRGNSFGYGPDSELLFLLNGATGQPTSFLYNGVGNRVARTPGPPASPSPSEYYFHDEGGDLLSIFSEVAPGVARAKLDVISVNGETLYTVEHNPTAPPGTPSKYELAYLNDHLGTPRSLVMVGGTGAPPSLPKTWRDVEYFPYGYEKQVTTWFTPSAGTPATPVGFQGHLKEAGATTGSNLWYFKARYHHAGIGRFSTVDPIADTSMSMPHTWNRYAFVWGDPVRFTDPLGTAVQVCSRKTSFKVGNHVYLWDDREGKSNAERSCGLGDQSGKEAGPATDKCLAVPESDGREEEVMAACEAERLKEEYATSKIGRGGYRPGKRDCHTVVEQCLQKNKLETLNHPRKGDPSVTLKPKDKPKQPPPTPSPSPPTQ